MMKGEVSWKYDESANALVLTVPYASGKGHPRFYALSGLDIQVHDMKNADYSQSHKGGDPLSNFKQSEEFGVPAWIGCLVRLSDKYSRVVQLAYKEIFGGARAVMSESIKDTLTDLGNYAKIERILYEEYEAKGVRVSLPTKIGPEGGVMSFNVKEIVDIPEKAEIVLRLVKSLEQLDVLINQWLKEANAPGMDDNRKGQLMKKVLSAIRAKTDAAAILLARGTKEAPREKDIFKLIEDIKRAQEAKK